MSLPLIGGIVPPNAARRLFRDGGFTAVIAAGQAAPCWSTRVGKLCVHRQYRQQDGEPSDIDAARGVLGVIDHGAGQSHLTLVTYNAFGELQAIGPATDLGISKASDVAIVPPTDDE